MNPALYVAAPNTAYHQGAVNVTKGDNSGVYVAAPGTAYHAGATQTYDAAQAASTAQQTQAQQAAAAQAQAAAQQQAQQNQLAQQYADQAGQLQGQLGNLDQQQNVGLGNIGNSYNQQYNQLQDAQAVAQRNYNQQGQQNTQNFSSAQNNALTQTRSANSALQRLLGMNGAGNSSAAYEQAPYAAALQGSQLVNGAQKTYGQNQQSLDTNWQDTTRKFKNSQDDLNNQKYQQENGLKSSIAQNRASLLDQMSQANINHDMALGKDYTTAKAAQGGLNSQVQSLLSQITQLGNQYQNPVLKAQDVSYQAPSLSQYSMGSIGAPQQGGAAPGTSDVSPSFLSLLSNNQKRDAYGNLVTA